MPVNKATKSVIGSSSFSIISVIVIISIFIYNVYMKLKTHTDYIINIGECPEEIYNIHQFLCVFHPLFVSDEDFRNSVIQNYDVGKVFKAIGYLYDGSWTRTPAPDGYLKYMVMNPWYISDEKNFVQEFVYYDPDLTLFEYKRFTFSAFKGDDGLYISKYTDPESKNVYWYMYIDFSIMMKIRKDIVEGTLKINNANDVESALLNRFYEFYRNNLRVNTCDNLDRAGQDKVVKQCLFFNPKTDKTPESFTGLVIALRRIIVVALEAPVIDEYITRIDTKLNKSQNISRMEFFMWLAMKSHRDSIKFKFKTLDEKSV
uniref:Uncharacterized protein n=1 Tax=viral metagenome TaxID=1070528 RepID=A0A6C0H7V5_9ZZZZ